MRLSSSAAALFVAGVVGFANHALAIEIPLTNASFEDPADQKTVGDATWSNIPGWTSTGPSADSGIEGIAPAVQPELGTHIAFLQSGDGAIHQTTNYNIVDGENYLVTFYQRADFQATEVTVRLYYDDNGTRTVFGEDSIALAGIPREEAMPLASLLASAPSAALGLPIGVEFENTSLGGATGSWAWVDLVTLQTTGGPGDVNEDGFVDLLDYAIIRDHFQTTVGSRTDGDLTLDGLVDFNDFIQWRDNAAPAALAALQGVPEPASAVLALLAFGLVSGRRAER